MRFIQIEILNPKANTLIKDLADQKLIAIKENSSSDNFFKKVRQIRNKAKADAPQPGTYRGIYHSSKWAKIQEIFWY